LVFSRACDDILTGDGVKKLRWAFTPPQKSTPEKTRARIAKATADTLLAVAEGMWRIRHFDGALLISSTRLCANCSA